MFLMANVEGHSSQHAVWRDIIRDIILDMTVNAYMHVQVCDRCWTFIFHVRTILGMGPNHWLQFVVQSVNNPMINLELEIVYG